MDQPPGFADLRHPNHVCYLHRVLYGLKHAPRAWFDRFSSFLLTLGFFCSVADSSLFVRHSAQGIIIILLYVDDIVLTGDDPIILQSLISTLSIEYAMKDLGLLHYFLGTEAT